MRNATGRCLRCPLAVLLIFILLGSIIISAQTTSSSAQPAAHQDQPTLAEAQEFIQHAETRLNELAVKDARASWVQSNFITDDTEIISAEANEALIGATTELAKQATRYDQLQMPPDLARKMLLYLFDRARSAGTYEIFLEVRPSNTAAARLYQSLGFEQVGIRRGYYQATVGREDAAVLRRTLTPDAKPTILK